MNKLIFFIIFTCMSQGAWALTNLFKIDENFYRQLILTPATENKDFEIEKMVGVLDEQSKIIAVHEHQFLQNFLDEAIARILLNERGVNFCHFYTADPLVIKMQTAVSFPMAKYIAQECGDRLHKKFGGQVPGLGKVNLKFMKKFYFVIGSNKKLPLDSWTTRSNETFIMLDRPEQMINLYRRIIHELYIPYDHKFTLGRGRFNTVEDGFYEVKNHKLFNYGAKDDLEDILGLIPFPLFKFSFSITRAIMFEDQILKSLFIEEGKQLSEEYLFFTTQDCWKHFEKMGNKLFVYQDMFMPIEEYLFSKIAPNPDLNKLYVNKDGPRLAVEFIQQRDIYLYDKDIKRNVSFCEYMSTPLMSSVGVFFSRGPRPRLGSGWGGSNSYLVDGAYPYQNFNDFAYHSKIQNSMSSHPSVDSLDIIREMIKEAQKREEESKMLVIPASGDEE